MGAICKLSVAPCSIILMSRIFCTGRWGLGVENIRATRRNADSAKHIGLPSQASSLRTA